MASAYLYWDELRGQPINVAGQGRQIGGVEDFYDEPDVASIKVLRVNAGLSGYRILLVSVIAAIERDGVTIANEKMLIDETNAGDHSPLPLGGLLRGVRVITQDRDLGVVECVLLGISPLVALRLAAIELEGSHTRIAAHAIARFSVNDLRLLEEQRSRTHAFVRSGGEQPGFPCGARRDRLIIGDDFQAREKRTVQIAASSQPEVQRLGF